MTSQAPAKRREWSEEDIRKALAAEAITGSITRASALTGIPKQTISDWKHHHHPDLYDKIRKEVVPQVREQTAQDAEDVIRSFIDVARKTASKLNQKLDSEEDISAVDLSTIGRNAGVTGSVFNDKIVNPNRDRPSSIVAFRSPEAFMEAHKQFIVDADAVEITESGATATPQPRQLAAESGSANAQDAG